MSNAITQFTVKDIWQMAGMIAKSNLFGVKTQEEAASLMLIAQAEGLHPAVAARDYHIIQGRPCLKADAMLARFQQAGGVCEWVVVTDARVAAKFSHPTKSPNPVLIEWNNETVAQAQIRSDMHKKYPRQMKRARVISEGVRTVLPECVCGVYAPEEIATKVAELEALDREAGETIKPAEATVKAAKAPKTAPTPESEPAAPEAPRKVPAPKPDHKFMVRGDAFDTEHKTIAEMDDGELEHILRTARTTLDDDSMAHAHDYAHAAIRMVRAERESRKQGAVSPAPEAGAEATQAAPAAAEPAPEAPVALPEVEADVLTAKTLILCGRVAGKPHKKVVKDMDSNERQIAYDEAQMALSDPDPKKRAHAMGVINLLEANK